MVARRAMHEINQIINGDAFEVLEGLDDNSVNAIITDPPYNISTDFEINRDGSGNWDGGTLSHDFGDWDQGDVMPHDWIPDCVRALKDNGVFISMYDNLNMDKVILPLRAEGLEIRQKFYWHKKNPAPQAFGVKWQTSVEEGIIATMNEGQGHHYQDKAQRHNVIETSVCSGKERMDHPTQKPEELFETLVEWWTEEGDLIVDPFCGTGTVPKVAHKYGRDYIGVEKNEDWATKAQGRIGNTPGEINREAMDW